MSRLLEFPLLVLLSGIVSLAMLVPAAQALVVRDLHEARTFFYGAILFSFLTILVAIATRNSPIRKPARNQLLNVLGTFTVIPALAAVPFYEALETAPFLFAYFEMVSSMTTTGATLFDDPAAIPDSLHLWRAIIGWLGGAFLWVSALAILAPLNLGGFEVGSGAEQQGRYTQISQMTTLSDRLKRYGVRLLPIYTVLTLVLWIGLVMVGERPFVAVCHAMAILSTSGISPVGGVANGSSGMAGEALILLFFVFALSRQTFSTDQLTTYSNRLREDPEFRIGLLIGLGVPILLFVRHWVGAFEGDQVEDSAGAFRALWGSLFTTVSFLTTTGFSSGFWGDAQIWSGLQTPGLILMGLALVGGGVATTAGGGKLLRGYALYKHGQREIDRLVHPSSIAGSGGDARRIRRQGAYIAWIFFMLFALTLALILTLLALTGLDFETATVLSIAALSTTGPLATEAAAFPISYAALTAPAQGILIAAMVLGRLETLAIIALLNPDFWRR